MKYIGYLLKISLVILAVSCGSKFEHVEQEDVDTIINDSVPACQQKIHDQQIEVKEVEYKLDSIEILIKENKKERRKLKKQRKNNGY